MRKRNIELEAEKGALKVGASDLMASEVIQLMGIAFDETKSRKQALMDAIVTAWYFGFNVGRRHRK